MSESHCIERQGDAHAPAAGSPLEVHGADQQAARREYFIELARLQTERVMLRDERGSASQLL